MLQICSPDISRIPALRSLWKEAFCDTDTFLDAFFSTAFCADRCRCATLHEDVTAALYWFDCFLADRPIAYIYAVATAKAYQKQGICHQLLENTHQHLKKQGYAGALLVPGSEALFRFYADMGYRTTCYIHTFSCSSIGNTIPLRSIDKKEYTLLRRHFLPEKGVLQEKENIDFLETQMHFYAGRDFVLAACIENAYLYGAELLGNSSAAPAIIHTLGCKNGTFRTPGKDTPFAMYHSLDTSFPLLPTYFGLPFD